MWWKTKGSEKELKWLMDRRLTVLEVPSVVPVQRCRASQGNVPDLSLKQTYQEPSPVYDNGDARKSPMAYSKNLLSDAVVAISPFPVWRSGKVALS